MHKTFGLRLENRRQSMSWQVRDITVTKNESGFVEVHFEGAREGSRLVATLYDEELACLVLFLKSFLEADSDA